MLHWGRVTSEMMVTVASLILSRRLGSEIAIFGYSGEELLPVSSYAVPTTHFDMVW